MTPATRTSPVALQVRLHRIEGQVCGINAMVADDKDCIDIITQVAATTRALQAVALLLLDEHLHQWLRQPDLTGRPPEDRVEQAARAIARLVRS
ncbi:metal-sensitive transcriptional regulator [Ornithinimicrobium sp. Y1694]|uniref:metal-sensitive transcriptional regulator n=1 Tax=Ornithinimicrobium sp. Y1694 TaxID=3418590 RepID=UPI003CF4C0FC